MQADIEKNRLYYESDKSSPCDCEYCRRYCDVVKERYLEIAKYLKNLGVDVARPFELSFFENEERDEIEYYSCQYLVFGECEDNFEDRIGDVKFQKSDFHPSVPEDVPMPYFILEFGPLYI